MSDLNKDLREYLSKTNASDSSTDSNIFSSFKPNNFGKWFNTNPGNGYVSVPTTEPEQGKRWWFADEAGYPIETEDSCFPSLSKKQRIIGCIIFASMGMFCMGMASLLIPFLILKARKFALLYTLGSLFLISSFSVLWGPASHIKHLCTLNRLPFSLAYFGSMAATIYFAMVTQSSIATVLCALVQVLALMWYVISYVPGGPTGLKFFSKIFSSGVTSAAKKALPV